MVSWLLLPPEGIKDTENIKEILRIYIKFIDFYLNLKN